MQVGSTWRSSSTSSLASSWDGRHPGPCTLSSLSMPWRWRSGYAAGSSSAAPSMTPIVACSTWPSATPSDLRKLGSSPQLGRRASYDNALAESFNGLYKTEMIRKRGPWRGLDDVEYATLEYVDWFNPRRLHGELGMIPPAEIEAIYYDQFAPALLA